MNADPGVQELHEIYSREVLPDHPFACLEDTEPWPGLLDALWIESYVWVRSVALEAPDSDCRNAFTLSPTTVSSLIQDYRSWRDNAKFYRGPLAEFSRDVKRANYGIYTLKTVFALTLDDHRVSVYLPRLLESMVGMFRFGSLVTSKTHMSALPIDRIKRFLAHLILTTYDERDRHVFRM